MERDEAAVTTNQAEAAAATGGSGTSEAGEKPKTVTTTTTKKPPLVTVDTNTRPFPVLTEEQLSRIQDPVEREEWRELMARAAKHYYESRERRTTLGNKSS